MSKPKPSNGLSTYAEIAERKRNGETLPLIAAIRKRIEEAKTNHECTPSRTEKVETIP